MSKKAKIPYKGTEVSMAKTKAEIENLLKGHGILDTQWTSYHGETTLQFIWKVVVNGVEKEIMFKFSPPFIPAKKKTWVDGRYQIITVNLEAQSYRLLWHYLKNKLDAVLWGMETIEKEFLSHAVVSLPDGTLTTVGDRINMVYESVKRVSLIQMSKEEEGRIIDVK